jgi:hypothetical protein
MYCIEILDWVTEDASGRVKNWICCSILKNHVCLASSIFPNLHSQVKPSGHDQILLRAKFMPGPGIFGIGLRPAYFCELVIFSWPVLWFWSILLLPLNDEGIAEVQSQSNNNQLTLWARESVARPSVVCTCHLPWVSRELLSRLSRRIGMSHSIAALLADGGRGEFDDDGRR